MSKPIFIMRIPLETLRENRELVQKSQRSLQRKLKDYHVITMGDNTIKRAEFECFSIDDEQIKEIQTILKKYGYDEFTDIDTPVQDRAQDTGASK